MTMNKTNVNALRVVFGADLINDIVSKLDAITPTSDRTTCGQIVEETADHEDDMSTRRVALDKCLMHYPHLSVRKGRDGGIVHADEEKSEPRPKAGKTVSAVLAALEAQGVTLTEELVHAAVKAAKESRKD